MFDQQTLPTILCCLCGTQIPSNPSNMCVNCIRGQVDITEGIPKQLTIHWCRGCGRYLQPPNHWIACELESRELLTYCLKKIKGLSKVKLVDAGFVWTEPHSRRLKVKLTVQKEVFTSTILQQVFIVEFVVHTQQCDKCQRVMAKDVWNAVVQARQKVEHKRTFYFLEQLILKQNAHSTTINIKERPDGLDFFFSNRSHAMKFVDFLQAVVPVRYKTSDQLVSHDEHSNTYNYKYTFSVEIVPICRDDLLCLPPRVAASMGCSSPVMLVWKLSNMIHLVDPNTLHTIEFTATNFWKEPFRSLCTHQQMVEYTILDVVPLGPVKGKWVLAEVQLAKSSDLGSNDTLFTTHTHLGHILKPGDTALGYDVASGNYNDADLKALKGRRSLPDVVLVRKVYPNNRKANRRRHWKLRHLDVDGDSDVTMTGAGSGRDNKRGASQDKQARDYEQFLRDLEEDPEMRSNILLYKVPGVDPKAKTKPAGGDIMMGDDESENNDPAFPEVGIEELLDELDINDNDVNMDDE
jgi:nonsense-mediated mRNA decay protein 3